MGLVIGLEHEGWPCIMCESKRQKWGHTKNHGCLRIINRDQDVKNLVVGTGYLTLKCEK